MTDKQLKLLENLMSIPSPSGFEDDIAKYISDQMLKLLPKKQVEIDNQKNVIVTIPGRNPEKKVMIDAHSDLIGFMVTNIDNRGIISLQYIGGGDVSILSARELQILTNKDIINAVVDRKHAHLIGDEEDENIGDISEAQVDIGIRKRKEVQKYVKIGDPVVYKPKFQKLVKNYYSGYGFDDKSGCFVLMETIRKIVKSKRTPENTLIFTFSAQEETGYTKSRPLVRKYKPDLFIENDVTFASDYLNDDLEKEVGKCELGKGMVVYRGVDIDKKSTELMEQIAKKYKIKYQVQASTGRNGYVAGDMTEFGVKIMITSIPLRNMHCPVETINLMDLETGSNLLKEFLLSKKLLKGD